VIGWDWIKSLFESRSHKQWRASRKDLHENRQEMQRSISTAMESNRKSSKALDVAERALRMLEKNRNEQKQ
jgi:isoaspartyl peptidase/L-asparaginase-like protein (Ntn-hydrolase superfamily)